MNSINLLKSCEKRIWTSGSGVSLGYDQVFDEILKYSKKDCKIFIGSDSAMYKKQITFCSAICIHGNSRISKYFFNKYKVNEGLFPNLISRILEETRLSLDIANNLVTEREIPNNLIEVHLDVSPFEAKTKTSKFSDMLKGYVSGAGFNYQLKPFAWASQSVADKHSK